VTNALPAILVGLTALFTSGLVHAAYAVGWLLGGRAYDGNGALAVSGTVTAVVLVAGLAVRRLVAGRTSPAAAEPAPIPVVARRR
jgi:hypothetical protein